jgi:hypothetical protein
MKRIAWNENFSELAGKKATMDVCSQNSCWLSVLTRHAAFERWNQTCKHMFALNQDFVCMWCVSRMMRYSLFKTSSSFVMFQLDISLAYVIENWRLQIVNQIKVFIELGPIETKNQLYTLVLSEVNVETFHRWIPNKYDWQHWYFRWNRDFHDARHRGVTYWEIELRIFLFDLLIVRWSSERWFRINENVQLRSYDRRLRFE